MAQAKRKAQPGDRKRPADERVGWSLPEWAERRGISRSGAYEARKRGETPAEVRVGRRVIITEEADQAWARRALEVRG